MDYGEAFALQKAIHALQIEGKMGEGLLLVEHPPVITVGRLSDRKQLFATPDRLTALGVAVVETDRGGQMTYHGPGQIVAYPLVNVTATGLTLHGFVQGLEQAVIDTLQEFGIDAGRVKEHTGVWVGDEKICAIGLRIRRWWNLHGLAFNIDPNLDHFGLFVPCGITDRGVTSLRRLLGRPVTLNEVKPILAGHLGRIFGCEWKESLTREEVERRAVQQGDELKNDGLGQIDKSNISGHSMPGEVESEDLDVLEREGIPAGGLEAEGLAAAVVKAWPALTTVQAPEFDSTRVVAESRLAAGVEPPFLVLAESHDSDPEGTGVEVSSPTGSSLAFTLVLPVESGVLAGAATSPNRVAELVGALSMAEALDPFCPRKARIGWPGDVLIQGRRVGIVTAGQRPTGGEEEERTQTDPSDPADLTDSTVGAGQGESVTRPPALPLTVLVNVFQGEFERGGEDWRGLAAETRSPELEATSLLVERRRAEMERVEVLSPDHARLRRDEGKAERARKTAGGGTGKVDSYPEREDEKGSGAGLEQRPEMEGRRALEPLDRVRILERILSSLRARLGDDFVTLRAPLYVRCSTVGRGVRVEREDGSVLEGLAVGIDPDGALVVEVRGEKAIRVRSGRVRELPHV